ncbi:MAG: hypothetical protein LC749_11905 [Actinobacteria bacterium]|nr:hypothetical protein [Actinomycetota bacterium]
MFAAAGGVVALLMFMAWCNGYGTGHRDTPHELRPAPVPVALEPISAHHYHSERTPTPVVVTVHLNNTPMPAVLEWAPSSRGMVVEGETVPMLSVGEELMGG